MNVELHSKKMLQISLQPSSHQRGLNLEHLACKHQPLTINTTKTWLTMVLAFIRGIKLTNAKNMEFVMNAVVCDY